VTNFRLINVRPGEFSAHRAYVSQLLNITCLSCLSLLIKKPFLQALLKTVYAGDAAYLVVNVVPDSAVLLREVLRRVFRASNVRSVAMLLVYVVSLRVACWVLVDA
jgi:hypothetical protein